MSKTTERIVTDRYTYTVGICGDIDPDAFGDTAELLDYAIDLARDMARIWAVPCTWRATLSADGRRVVVTRRRRATPDAVRGIVCAPAYA